MSRADGFDAFYRESHDRLLHQVYAYEGVTEVAQRALSDAYVSAAQHWRKVAASADKDAWMRQRAFKATSHSSNRSRDPWYITARGTADENRRLLAALAELPPRDRHHFVAVKIAGLDPAVAAAEAGVPREDATASLERSTHALATSGLDTAPVVLGGALEALRNDLRHDPPDRSGRLRREGNRRRHSYQVLATVGVLAVAIGAAIVVANNADDSQQPTANSLPPTTPSSTSSTSPSTTAPPPPAVSVADLTAVDTVRELDPTSTWHVDSTSADFGASNPPDPCVANVLTDQTADHYWVRQFSTGKASAPAATRTTATQTLEVDASNQEAQASYAAQLEAFGTCADGGRRLVSVKRLSGVADVASVLELQYVTSSGLRDELVSIGRSGSVMTTWIVHIPHDAQTRSRPLVKLLAAAVSAVCKLADGSCPAQPFKAAPVLPPPDEAAPGFLATVDLPLFEDVPAPWVATAANPTLGNPSATSCDQADFVAAGARDITSRSYVVPSARALPDSFGMTETLGKLSSRKDANAFVDSVAGAVSSCPDNSLTLTVPKTTKVTPDRGYGFAWQIDLATSSNSTLVYRVALIRVGSTVAEVTFTPSGTDDTGQSGFVALVTRAAERLTQL